MDNIILGVDNPFRETIVGIPSGDSAKPIHAVVRCDRYGMARMKGESRGQTFVSVMIVVSKTDWPVVTKNEDKFTVPVEGVLKTLTAATVVNEDSVSYTIALI